MKKVLTVLLVLLTVGSIIGCIFLFLQKEKVIADRDALIQQNSQLQQSIDAIGPFTTCYTVKTMVRPGDELVMDNIVELSVPVSNTSDNTISDITQFCGPNIEELDKWYYKVRVEPNTPLTKDMVMQDYMDAPVYERDIILPFKPVGLKVGDYIDIRVTLPGGEELRALTHKRVYMIMDNVIKLKLTEGELYVYTTLLTDHQYFGNIGLKLYATKYIEPGLSFGNEPLPMYPVSNYAATLLNQDPEIKNKTDYVNTDLRNYIEQILLFYADAEADVVFPGLPTQSHEQTEAGTLNQAQALFIDTYYGEDGQLAANVNDLSGTGSDGNLDGFEDGHNSSGDELADLNGEGGSGSLSDTVDAMTNDGFEDLNDAAEQIQQQQQQAEEQNNTNTGSSTGTTVPETMGNVDSEGNRSNIDAQDKNDAKTSGNIFSDADDID